ncbi:hypothetical protein [Rathayibacter sp. VKM Ac-2630]|uniref:hypothetical protein n=1 Tax=Rathayibacter sp. VKM Ac-2630 TaxID=1938617 RepID=UPI000981D4EE|nr:hypothetical protein [Rathayibacter sp. VKM Ac-2630]OOB90301.1 hypothetical protein B0T42_12430 [Rathayibacter sp. VKM Ac-2630]
MSATLITTQHVQRANAVAIADLLASIAGVTLSLRPLVQFADQPIEIETFANGGAFLHATLAIELDADQLASIKQLTEIDEDSSAPSRPQQPAFDHDHRPVQHRDAKPPWCPVCKLTAEFRVPHAHFDAAREGRASKISG